MQKLGIGIGLCLLVVAVPWWGTGLAGDNSTAAVRAVPSAQEQSDFMYQQTHKSAAQRRQEANARLRALRDGMDPEQAAAASFQAPQPPAEAPALTALTLPSGMNPAVDLLLPNYANSPNIRKFWDTLPGLAAPITPGAAYIPLAVADPNAYPGSDYYEIALVAYSQKMNIDLPPTDLRGYVQLETPANAGVSKHVALTYPDGTPIMYNSAQALAVDNPLYLGPTILAAKGRAVRVKFVNLLPPGMAGDLPFPVDMGVMGAGMGPVAGQMFTQNRGTLHLHGGRTPWISDGTPHQWTVPVGETSVYQKGVSATDVPDMPVTGQGELTFYWTNEQSARLLFYHDHAWGITRLNVYAGEAAGYVIHDQVEDDLIDGTDNSGVFAAAGVARTPILPNQAALGPQYRYGIPLVIQDKSWVNDPNTPPGPGFAATGATPTPYTAVVDPLWPTYVAVPGKPLGATKGGNLWIPHEYVVNENIYDPTGITVMGRWDYGPWMNPPMTVMNNVLPTPTITPESFMDTVTVNGCAFPTVTLPAAPVRLRILSVANDRALNLSLFYAEPISTRLVARGSGYTAPIVHLLTSGCGCDGSWHSRAYPGRQQRLHDYRSRGRVTPPRPWSRSRARPGIRPVMALRQRHHLRATPLPPSR